MLIKKLNLSVTKKSLNLRDVESLNCLIVETRIAELSKHEHLTINYKL